MKLPMFFVALSSGLFPISLHAFELQAVLATPQPVELVAASAASTLAWSDYTEGRRNLWRAEAPAFVPQQITRYTEDDGQEIGSLAISADGKTLLYVRGLGGGADGLARNPDSRAAGAEQAVWLAAATPRRIAAGHSPVLSPNGEVVIIERDKTLHCHAVASDVTPPAWCTSPLQRARGINGNARFSPDGQRLAFVSDRDDRSFIGVLDLASGRVQWIAADANRDAFPVWSPDGHQIAFIRVAARKTGELYDVTAANAFALVVADADSGIGREIFHSNASAGGAAQSGQADGTRAPLRWSRDGQLLFYSEQSGWLHVHAIPARGGDVRDLTPGACEVETSALDDAHDRLYVSSNCGGLEQRHLWSIALRNGKATPLTHGERIDTDPIVVGDKVALRSADAIRPTTLTLLDPQHGTTRAIFPGKLPSDFPQEQLLHPQAVEFAAADGLTIHGQLFASAAVRHGKHPALIFVHGGPMRQMLPGWHYMAYYYNAYAMNQWLASQGFVVLAINFRSGIGYGQAFRRAPSQGPRGASEYQDVLAANAYLAQLGYVDSARIGIWGGSYGGYLTALALARNSDRFAAGVDFHGVHDWRLAAKDEHGGDWGLDESLYDLAYHSSPVADVDRWRSPVLFIHGDDDHSVAFNQTTDLVERLRERQVPVQTLIFPDEEHDFLRYATWQRAYTATRDFFLRTLKP